ncbi:MAG TPA: hypothetical protein PKH65_09660 [Bacteroidia bacterium]|nr:hypothetical protein [Bacteroidia bacterium]HNT80934.1 hypothetical protein [Bacteroidia bacterium]
MNLLVLGREIIMIRLIKIGLLFLFLAQPNVLSAQQNMLLMDGKEIKIQRHFFEGTRIRYVPFESKSLKSKYINRYNVFSISDSGGIENVLYVPDSSYGDPSVEDLRLFIKGEQAAMLYYRKPANKWSSLGVGAASGFMSFYGTPVPFLYSTIIGRHNPSVEIPDHIFIPEAGSEAFNYGYEKKARNIKIKQSLIWGYIGFGISLSTLVALSLSN